MSTSPESIADALPREIKRVQQKRERWLGYEREAGPQANFKPALFIMQNSIDNAVAALASGDVTEMIAAYQDLQDQSDND